MGNNILNYVEDTNSEFYPTPQDLVNKMLAGLDFNHIETILEPSAGKGDILRGIAFKENLGCQSRHFDVDCIEKDSSLRQILKYNFSSERKRAVKAQAEGYFKKALNNELTRKEQVEYDRLNREKDTFFEHGIHIVHDDFLSYDTCKHYDLIILNPPFSDGAAHLHKAIKMQERLGGIVVCLLNAETVRNPHTRLQIDVVEKLKKLNAEITYIEDAFVTAERKTDVEVALIKVRIECKQESSEIYDKLRKAEKVDEFSEHEQTELEINDYIKAFVALYRVEVKSGMELIYQYKALCPYILNSFEKETLFNAPILKLCLDGDGAYTSLSENRYVERVRHKYWYALLHNPKFVGKLTSSLQDKYRAKVDKLKDYEFSEFNINELVIEMNTFIKSGIEEEAAKMFDRLTIKHTYLPEMLNNVHYFNGWTTNKACKIGKKVILPCYGVFSSWSGKPEAYKARDVLEDIERVLNYFDGNMSRETASWDNIGRSFAAGITKNIETKFFNVTFYKKGTVHIVFTCPELIDRFNIYSAGQKNELPPSYGKKAYADMTDSERAVIDSFQGEKAYAEVLKHADYYLAPITQNNTLMLGTAKPNG